MHNYLYKGFLVEVSEKNEFWTAIVHHGYETTTVTESAETQEEAEFAAETLIDSWN